MKTEMCQHFLRGICPYGDNCKYAHSWSDVRRSEFGDTVRNLNGDDVSRSRFGMKECYRFNSMKGCPYGDKCSFRHVPADQRIEGFLRQSSVYGGNDISSRSKGYTTSDGYDRGIFYKTRLCTKWVSCGDCCYGEKCTYAHGIAELKQGPYNYAPKEAMASNSIVTVQIGSGNADDEKLERKSLHFMKWSTQKIGRIYGDWIDAVEDLNYY